MVCTVAPGSSADYVILEQAEYHLGGREPTGRWYAPGADLGLADGQEIDNAVFRQVHEGVDPRTGEQIGKPNAAGERVAGYDAQFAAPKSVSILWALADDATRAKIEACQERAVRAALDFCQQAGAQIRTGHNGVTIEKVRIFGATFQHGESRPTERADGLHRSDPQLHTHTIIMNLGQGADGKWRALDGRPLMALQKAMGAQYHAELARLLETELGTKIERKNLDEARHNGEFELAGIDPGLIEQFSTRRSTIAAETERHGVTTREAAELAGEITLATRQGKSDETREEQLARWAEEAAEAGHTWQSIQSAALGQHIDQAAQQERANAYEESVAQAIDRLTETESVFSQADLYAALAQAGAGRGVGAADVIAIERDLIASGQLVALAKDETGKAIHSTRDLITVEQQIDTWAAEDAARYPTRMETPTYGYQQPAERRPDPFAAHEHGPFGPAEGSAAKPLHRVRRLSSIGLAHDAEGAEMLLPGHARDQLDVGGPASADGLRRGIAGAEVAPHTIPAEVIRHYLGEQADIGRHWTEEQKAGLAWIGRCGGGNVVLEGGAGTGKTAFCLQGTADLYHAQGYKVLATAQRWVTTLDLAKIKTPDGQHIEGRAAAKWISDFRRGKAKIDAKTVILVDEAGQMGSREVHALMAIQRQTGCRIVWTGDLKQQKAVAAGDPLAVLARCLGSYRLQESQRMRATAADCIAWRDRIDHAEAHQRAMVLSKDERADLVAQYGDQVNAAGAVWARQMADDFAHGRAPEALRALREHDQLIWTDKHDQALDHAVADWAEFKAENAAATAVVSAARHADVRGLNARMREHLRSIGQIGEDVATVAAVAPNGDSYGLALAVGDQIRLGANLRELGAFNGMLGIVRDIQPGSQPGHPLLAIDLHTPQGVRQIEIETQRLADEAGRVRLAHGYAATNVLIQGATEDALFGQVSSRDRSNAAYVVASRARQFTTLYASREVEDAALKRKLPLSERPGAQFTDAEREAHLAAALSRAQTKKMTTDYTQESRPPADVVLDAAADLAAARNAGIETESKMDEASQREQVSERVKDIEMMASEAMFHAYEEDDESYREATRDLENAVQDALLAGLEPAVVRAAVAASPAIYFAGGPGASQAILRVTDYAIAATLEKNGALPGINDPGRTEAQHRGIENLAERRRMLEADAGRWRQRRRGAEAGVTGQPAKESFDAIAARYRALGQRDIAAVTTTSEHALVYLTDGRTIRDTGTAIKIEGHADARAARTLAAMATARGWGTVDVKGTEEEKKWIADALTAVSAKVSNPEMQAYVRDLQENQITGFQATPVKEAVRDGMLAAAKDVQDGKPTLERLWDRAKELLGLTTANLARTAERPPVDESLSPADRLQRRFGQEFDAAALKDVADVRLSVSATEVDLAGGGRITHHHGKGDSVCHGLVTPQRAALMAAMMKADGHTSVTVRGTPENKEILARAAIQAGLGVDNAEMRDFVASVQAEMAQQKAHAKTAEAMAGMRAAPSEVPRGKPSTLDSLHAARLTRELGRTTDPVQRFDLAEQLKTFGTHEALAVNVQMAAAPAIVADRGLMQMAVEKGIAEKVATVAAEAVPVKQATAGAQAEAEA